MSRYELANEASRAAGRPIEDPIDLLGRLVVTPIGAQVEYAERLRSVIKATLSSVRIADFNQGIVSIEGMPDWFVELTDGLGVDAYGHTPWTEGKRRYLELRQNNPWGIEEWIYCFDPDLRAWSWWDLTDGGDGRVDVWIDTKAEAHIPCEELWWAIFACGARNVSDLTLEYAEKWSHEISLGGN